MTTYDMTDFAAQVDGVLRPLGITRNMRAYRTLSEALRLIYEQEDRLEAVQKEIYEPLADRHCCDWTAIQSMIRRAAQTAWATNHAGAASGRLPADRLPQCRAVSGAAV